MNEARTYSVRDVSTGVYDGPHATPPPSDSGAIFLGIRNITEDGLLKLDNPRYISEEDLPKWTKRVTPREGDIVFSYEATLNLYAIIPEGFRGCLGRRMGLIRPNPEVVDGNFLYYYFFSPQWRKLIAQKTVIGSTVNRIPIETFPDFKLLLPCKPIQSRIAALLSSLDEKIKHNNELIKILEVQIQQVYDYWFMQFDFPDENGRPYRSSGGKMVWHGELRRSIPDGWSMEKLDSLCFINSDTYKEREKWEVVRYLDTSNLTENRIDTIETIRLGVDKLPSRARRKVKDEDILFSTVRPNQLHYGLMIDPEPNLLVSTGFAVLTAKKECVSPYLVYAVVTSAPVVNALQKKAELATSAYPSIRPELLAEIQIPVPPPDSNVMKAYDALTRPLYRRIDACLKENNELTAQRDFLLPRLMTGEITVAE